MSLINEKDVSKIVEKYRKGLPELERPLLRSLILAENKWLKDKTRTLDRHLKKAFKNQFFLSEVKSIVKERVPLTKEVANAMLCYKTIYENFPNQKAAKGIYNYLERVGTKPSEP